ncbi:flagellar hook-basal body complex protein [bacterium]|nr:flagellar hook-basal body complex protein [bacterium]
MGLTTALNTSLNGLALNETAIEVIGNNISNANTNGFKASTVEFTTQLARTLSVGSASAPGVNGGTNPRQVGLGAAVAEIRRDNSQGAISTSASPSDLAIEGKGYFVLSGNQGPVYTRNGSFTLNKENQLVNAQGLRVQGYGIDDQYNITSVVGDLVFPLPTDKVAQATTSVKMEGSLVTDGNAQVATQRGIIATAQFTDANITDPLLDNSMTGTTLLSDVRDGDGNPVFTVGETIHYTPTKGEATYSEETFDITATSMASDFTAFLSDVLGLDTANGASVMVTGGKIQITSNEGKTQDVGIPAGNELQQSNGSSLVQLDLGFDRVQSADGDGAVATFAVYDSLGEQLSVRMHTVIESTTPTTQIRYYLESSDDSDLATLLGTGTFDLDSSGSITGNSLRTFTINRGNTAANDLSIDLDLSNISGLSNSNSSLNLLSQDGAPSGTLSSFNINDSGVINGVFDNGVIRPLGQIVLRQFQNDLGLVEAGNGTFRAGVSSGEGRNTTPGADGTGQIRAGAIELSNTDVGRSLVDLIVASTNYRGNARVISSTQQLVDELLVLGR